jgi:hypothetical protein
MLETVLLFAALCLVVSLVYTAARRDGMGAILREGLHLFLVTVGGLVGLAAVIYLISRFLQPTLWL